MVHGSRLITTLVLLVAGCGAPAPSPTPHPALGGANATPLDLAVTVNGNGVGRLAPEGRDLTIDQPLPPLPWSVRAVTRSGRVIVTLDVPTDYQAGTYNATDLSCGRVMIWVGNAPILGPPPPSGVSGVPGDCEP